MKKKMMQIWEQDKMLLIKVIAGIIFLAIAFSFYLLKETAHSNEIIISDISANGAETVDTTTVPAVEVPELVIMVDVAGAVLNPSVVALPEGSRVFEAVEQAGGLTQEADTRAINQAEILTDGQKIYIPTKQEMDTGMGQTGSADFTGEPSSSGFGQAYSSGSGLVNINTADSAALQQLTGVGPATAEKIIQYRNEKGKFKKIDEIKNVSGIGEKTFEKFKDKITV